jgi:hypothetical protein
MVNKISNKNFTIEIWHILAGYLSLYIFGSAVVGGAIRTIRSFEHPVDFFTSKSPDLFYESGFPDRGHSPSTLKPNMFKTDS